MSKIEVTDEIVQRALHAGGWAIDSYTLGYMRRSLEAALNPPQEPEIVVSQDQKVTGARAYNTCAQSLNYAPGILQEKLTAAYRAMRRLEPEPEAACKHKWQIILTPYVKDGRTIRHYRCDYCGESKEDSSPAFDLKALHDSIWGSCGGKDDPQ